MTTSSSSEAAALQEPGELYRHKQGGIYRLDQVTTIKNSRLKWKGQGDYKRGELLVTYEHLWPHSREFYQRPHREFTEPGRFNRIVNLHG